MARWGERLRSRVGAVAGRRRGADVYEGLRSLAIGLDIGSIQTPDGEPWRGAAVAMIEIGMEKGSATFVAIADGSVSMYTSGGGGVIGAGGHAAVLDAATRFRIVAFESRGLLQRTDEFPVPRPAEVRFQVRTTDGGYTGVAPEAALRTGRHPLSTLYAAGQDLITEIRLSTPDGGGH